MTLYRVGAVKRSGATTWLAVDGGMSDNLRPALYGAQYSALLANRSDSSPDRTFAVCGKHCESGDVLIERVDLPRPTRGDLLGDSGHRRVRARYGVPLQRSHEARGSSGESTTPSHRALLAATPCWTAGRSLGELPPPETSLRQVGPTPPWEWRGGRVAGPARPASRPHFPRQQG